MLRLITTLYFILFTTSALACSGIELTQSNVYASPLCLPENPQRIVVLDASFGLGIALDAGLPVVGAPLDGMSDEALKARATKAGVTSIGFITEPSLETVVALQPDLILGYPGSQSMASGIYALTSQFAPTLLYTELDWRAFYRLLAEFADDEHANEIEKRLAAFDARLAEVRDRMPETTVSVVRITSWDFQVYLDAPVTYAPFELMQQAGVRRSAYETSTDPDLSMKRPDWEELAKLDGDILLYIVGGTNSSDEDGRHEEVIGNPLWQSLPAVKAGRVHRIDPATWMEFNGLAAAHRVLDDLESYVIEQ